MRGAGRWLVLALLLAGCSRPDPTVPPEILYGTDVCDECRMLIADPRHAAAWRTASGEESRFDDPGDMALHLARGAKPPQALWVHDYTTGEWLPAETAAYVLSPQFQTPMGHGVVAVAGRPRAEALAREAGGRVLGWTDMLEAVERAATKTR